MIENANSALWLLPFAAPICLWAAISDLRTMTIPNKSVLALVLVFAVIGFLTLPLDVYLWRWSHLAVVLVVGFVMSTLRLMGAGDAKFAAAMAPFVALADLSGFALMFCVVLLVSFALHRIARKSASVRKAAPGWESWERSEFPMGLALGAVLILYLARSI